MPALTGGPARGERTMICLPLTPTEIKDEYQIDIFETATDGVINDVEIRDSIVAACWRRFRHRPIGDFEYEYWQDILNDRVADLWVTYRYKCQYYKDRIIMDLTTSRSEESRTHETQNNSDVIRDSSSSDTTTYDITVDDSATSDITVNESATSDITVNESATSDITVDDSATSDITVNESATSDITVNDSTTTETENLPDTPVVAGAEYLTTRGKNTGQKQETGTSTRQNTQTTTNTGQKQETGTSTRQNTQTTTNTGQKNETSTNTRQNKQTGTTGNVGSTDETISTTGNVSGTSSGTVTRQDGLTVELLNRVYDNLRNPFADFAKELDPIFMNRW